jgi:hypothetical protein
MIETKTIEQDKCGELPERMQLPEMGHRPGKGEILNQKPCQYPGCTFYYMGTGFSKYCHEHRKREYHKPSKIARIDESNIIHNHNNIEPVDLEFICGLDGCGNIYKVKILPGVFIYPKYCDLHRNKWKRKLFTNKKGS